MHLLQLAADSGELVVTGPAITLNIRLSCELVRVLHRVLEHSIFNPQKSATHLTGYWHLCEPRTGTHGIRPRVSSCQDPSNIHTWPSGRKTTTCCNKVVVFRPLCVCGPYEAEFLPESQNAHSELMSFIRLADAE